MAAKIVAVVVSLALLLLRLAMVVLPTIPTAAAATLTEAPRVFMDTMEDMAMESVKLNLVMAMVMLSATLIGVPRVFMDTMEAMDMVTMVRGRLNPVMELLLTIHMVEAAQSIEQPKA